MAKRDLQRERPDSFQLLWHFTASDRPTVALRCSWKHTFYFQSKLPQSNQTPVKSDSLHPNWDRYCVLHILKSKYIIFMSVNISACQWKYNLHTPYLINQFLCFPAQRWEFKWSVQPNYRKKSSKSHLAWDEDSWKPFEVFKVLKKTTTTFTWIIQRLHCEHFSLALFSTEGIVSINPFTECSVIIQSKQDILRLERGFFYFNIVRTTKKNSVHIHCIWGGGKKQYSVYGWYH